MSRTPRDLQAFRARRDFLLASGTAGALVSSGIVRNGWSQEPATKQRKKVIDEFDPGNIKLARRVPGSIGDDDMLFLKQIGLRWARVDLTREQATFEHLRGLQQRFSRYGIKIFSAVHPVLSSSKVGLGLPGRDEEIEEYQEFLRVLGRLSIPVAGYAFHPGNTGSTGTVEHRGYRVRAFDLKVFRTKVEKQRFDREYSAEEMWNNYTYFMNAVLPVAEEANVKMALHPDDPPVANMNGVAKLFTHYEGYRRAEEIAQGSRHWGLLFCIGTWSEGGDKMGKDVFEMIRDFGSRGKIFAVHFRNVSGPLPNFYETFPDDGYLDLYQVMKSLREVGFNGSAIPDHIPGLVGDSALRRAGAAYCISYMRALLRRANEEVG